MNFSKYSDDELKEIKEEIIKEQKNREEIKKLKEEIDSLVLRLDDLNNKYTPLKEKIYNYFYNNANYEPTPDEYKMAVRYKKIHFSLKDIINGKLKERRELKKYNKKLKQEAKGKFNIDPDLEEMYVEPDEPEEKSNIGQETTVNQETASSKTEESVKQEPEEAPDLEQEYENEGFSKNAYGHYYNPYKDEYDEDYHLNNGPSTQKTEDKKTASSKTEEKVKQEPEEAPDLGQDTSMNKSENSDYDLDSLLNKLQGESLFKNIDNYDEELSRMEKQEEFKKPKLKINKSTSAIATASKKDLPNIISSFSKIGSFLGGIKTVVVDKTSNFAEYLGNKKESKIIYNQQKSELLKEKKEAIKRAKEEINKEFDSRKTEINNELYENLDTARMQYDAHKRSIA